MSFRHGPGPVFAFEWLVSSRRWQLYATRAFFGAALLVTLLVVWLGQLGADAYVSSNDLARVGSVFADALIGAELAMVLLVAPAATAGAIAADRASGKLTLMMTTDLSSAEIVLGKLFARLMPSSRSSQRSSRSWPC